MSELVLDVFAKFFKTRDRLASFIASAAIHVVLLIIGGLILVKPLEFAVQAGANGVEVNLVAAPTPVVEQVAPEPLPQVVKDPDPIPIPVQEVKPVETPPPPKPVTETQGKDATTFQSKGGALTEAKANYLSNPAPRYPWQAKQKGWEGTVTLNVAVDREGKPTQVEIEHSSGYDILDQSALKAVRGWSFKPAKLGTLAVATTVSVPVRFYLKDTE